MGEGVFRLFVGLGNPGSKFVGTRHNVGFMAIKKLAEQEGASFRKHNKLHGSIAEVGLGINRLFLLMPSTYMNDSGRSVRAALQWFGISVDQLLVIVDDMDIPLGRLRIREKGSAGGHNGLKSIIQHLGTQDFCRLRIGIGGPNLITKERTSHTISHVLGNFRKNEESLMEEVLNEVLKGVRLIQDEGIAKAGNYINAYKPKEFAGN